MSVTKQFNGLHGTTVTRVTLNMIRGLAKSENNKEVYDRISKLLETYPKAQKFEIEIDTPAREARGLGVPVVAKKKGEELHYMQDNIKVASINKHGVITWHKRGIPTKERSKIRKAANVIGLACPNPEEVNGMLHGIALETEDHEQIYGLGKAVSPNEIYDLVNNLMLNTIKEVGHLPWQKEWQGSGNETVMNYVTKKPYTGINALMLNFNTAIKGGKLVLVPAEFEQPYYLTFAQIEAAGAKLKKGSKGREVIYYNFVLNYKDGDLNFNGTDKKKFGEFATKNNLTAAQIESNLKRVPLLKYYNVYKADDCEGLKPHAKAVKKANPIEAAQEIIDGYPNHPKYIFGTDKAFYAPGPDTVNMPKINAFSSEADYYSTFFHEITHSTGAANRLTRDFSGRFGDAAYAFEELIAELGAVYLCAESGILFHTRENSAKYLRSWNKKLVQNMTNDNRFFMRAAAQAQKAADFILDKDNKKAAPKPKVQKKTKKAVKKPTPKPNAIEKPVVKPVAKVQKKTKETELKIENPVIGYAVVDNITGEVVAANEKKQKIIDFIVENTNDDFKGIEPLVYEIRNIDGKNKLTNKITIELPKVDKNGQTALFGTLNAPDVSEIETLYQEVPAQVSTIPVRDTHVPLLEAEEPKQEEKVNLPLDSKYKTAADRERENQQPKQLYKISGDLSKFLGNIEIKPVQSLAVTLDSEEGGGKTHTFYQWANEFYLAGYKPIIWSLEEHASSGLATDKSKEYFGNNWDKIVVESELSGESKEETYQRIVDSIKDFDVIFVDSWAKLVELNAKANFDQDFRKKFNGKLFFVIFQRTSSGEMRGGTKGAFDGDIILKVAVDRDDFRNNYIYNHKNRYNNYMPISELKYSPFYRKLITEPEPEEELVFTEEIERI